MKFNIKEIKQGFIANGYKFLYKQFTRDFYRRQCCNITPPPITEGLQIIDMTSQS